MGACVDVDHAPADLGIVVTSSRVFESIGRGSNLDLGLRLGCCGRLFGRPVLPLGRGLLVDPLSVVGLI